MGSLSRLNSSRKLLKHSVVSDPLSRKAYVPSCSLLPDPLTLTATTLKQTLGLLLSVGSTGSTGMESLDTTNVLDSVCEEGLDSVTVEAVPPTKL